MSTSSSVSTWILAGLGVCAWVGNPPAARAAQADGGKVTAVRLHFVPDSYAGPCPGHVQLVGDITTDGPGTVWYHFLAGAVSHSPEGTVSFSAAGTKTVTVEGQTDRGTAGLHGGPDRSAGRFRPDGRYRDRAA
jgi:hypothetical protein